MIVAQLAMWLVLLPVAKVSELEEHLFHHSVCVCGGGGGGGMK